MTQENIEVLLPPNTKLEDCTSECQVETGRTIGARYIITSEVLRFGSSLRISQGEVFGGTLSLNTRYVSHNFYDDYDAISLKTHIVSLGFLGGIRAWNIYLLSNEVPGRVAAD